MLWLALVASVVLPRTAWAAPLDLTGLQSLEAYVVCEERCAAGRAALEESCRGGCGAVDPKWEKNAIAPVNREDLVLARAEYWDDGRQDLICYRGGAVLPKAQCGLADCQAKHSRPGECDDRDQDGLFAWQEAAIGTADTDPQKVCSDNAQCGGFFAQCVSKESIATSICEQRVCGSGPCEAFRIVQKDVNDQELIVYVYFDYSPTPTALLDLYVTFDARVLKLIDSRPLEAVTSSGKTLAVRQVPSARAGAMDARIVVYSPASSAPIRTGAIAELVFQRLQPTATTVGFTQDLQKRSAAITADPSQDFRGQLASLQDPRSTKLWGAPVSVVREATNRLLLHYGFDDTRRSLSFSAAKSGEELGGLTSNLVGVAEDRRPLVQAALGALQRGYAVHESGDGVYGPGALFNGLGHHLELPLTPNTPAPGAAVTTAPQASSFATWFYADARPEDHAPEMLFSHNTIAERPSHGLALARGAVEGNVDIVWFEGELRDTSMRVVANVPLRRWTHVGFSVNASTNSVRVYVDGLLRASFAAQDPRTLYAAPVADRESPTLFRLHEEGEDIVGGRTPQSLYFASAQNNLNGIEQLDMRSFSRRTVVRLPTASAQDPDYSPLVDKIVYSSNASGSFEIWIANGDGSDARAITKGFGDTRRRIFARRPKFAPDASAIVFESNAFDYDRLTNVAYRSNHLYYVPFDASKRQVSIKTPEGGTTDVLDADFWMSRGGGNMDENTGQAPNLLDTFRVAVEWPADQGNALWLKGMTRDAQSDIVSRGTLLFTSTDAMTRIPEVRRVELPENLLQATSERIPVGTPAGPRPDGSVDLTHEVTALTATRFQPKSGRAQAYALVRDAWVSYEPSKRFTVNVVDEPNGAVTAIVKHLATGYGDGCWDTNKNGRCDVGENKSGARDAQGAPVCTVADCAPVEVSNLYVRFDATVIDVAEGGTVVAPSLGASGADKRVTVTPVYGTTSDALAIAIASPLNVKPLPTDTEVVRVQFQRKKAGATSLAAVERKSQVALQIVDLENGYAVTPFTEERTTGSFEEVLGAAFSPEGDRLLLSVIQHAQPTLLLTAGRTSSAGSQRLIAESVKAEGLSWTSTLRYYPANWVGAFRDPVRGQLGASFRGGLDDLRLYNYARSDEAFLSDSARGEEALAKDQKSRMLGGTGERECTVGNSLECPQYEVCAPPSDAEIAAGRTKGTCVTKTCDPNDASTCGPGQGHCTLAAVSATGGKELGWVCAAECNIDNECFRQQCLNGPCRFCDVARKSCGECRNVVQDFGAVQVAVTEGCPDQNSFSCDATNNCVSECYRTQNGTTKYMCDPATQYCRRGKCAMLDWDWTDVSPMTFAAAGDASYRDIRPTTVRSQLYPIVIDAFGVGDYGQPPEILVEGRTPSVRAGSWLEIGRILVTNSTRPEASADDKRYVLTTPYPLSELRLRLVVTPALDRSLGATGLMEKSAPFCPPGLGDECTYRAPSSRPTVGYEIGISRFHELLACARRGRCGADADQAALGYFLRNANPLLPTDVEVPYLLPGQPTAVVTRVTVNGTDVLDPTRLTSNKTCSYEGTADPIAALPGGSGVRRKRLFYGNAATEISNQKSAFYPAATATTLRDFRGRSNAGWALLNCNYAVAGATEVAGADFDLRGLIWKGSLPDGVIETANGCFVQLKGNGNNPGKREPCYEIKNADVVFDSMSSETDTYKTLEFQKQRSFGYDRSAGVGAGR